jgi:hypothetical protein
VRGRRRGGGGRGGDAAAGEAGLLPVEHVRRREHVLRLSV